MTSRIDLSTIWARLAIVTCALCISIIPSCSSRQVSIIDSIPLSEANAAWLTDYLGKQSSGSLVTISVRNDVFRGKVVRIRNRQATGSVVECYESELADSHGLETHPKRDLRYSVNSERMAGVMANLFGLVAQGLQERSPEPYAIHQATDYHIAVGTNCMLTFDENSNQVQVLQSNIHRWKTAMILGEPVDDADLSLDLIDDDIYRSQAQLVDTAIMYFDDMCDAIELSRKTGR